jgi:plasmid maintenance system antidote protein VapI
MAAGTSRQPPSKTAYFTLFWYLQGNTHIHVFIIHNTHIKMCLSTRNYMKYCIFFPKIHSMDTKDFWIRTNALIKQKGYTQRSLALKCGFTERRIESLSTDSRQPTTDESVKIAQALGVSVEYLVTGEKPDNSASVEKIQSLARQILDETSKIK